MKFSEGTTVKASSSYIGKLEGRVGASLTKPYVEFLSASGVGELDAMYKPHGFHSDIQDFYQPTDSANDVYSLVYALNVFGDRIPKGWLPIATDSGGSIYCLVLCGDDAGSVRFFDVAFEGEAGRTPVVANTFEEFLQNIEKMA